MDRWYRDCLETKSWGRQLDAAAVAYGDRPYLISDRRTLTFRQFKDEVDVLARGLMDLGVRSKDVVAIWMNNAIEWAVIQLAVYKVGAVVTPVYTHFTLPEVRYSLAQADVSVLFMDDSFMNGKVDALKMMVELCPEVTEQSAPEVRSTNFPSLRRVVVVNEAQRLPGRLSYQSLQELGARSCKNIDAATEAVDPFDVASIMFTSGTTGFPKGGLSMHVTTLCSFSLSAQRLGLDGRSVMLHNYPMFTNAGVWVTSMGLTTGCTVVLLGERYREATAALEAIERHRVTHAAGTTTHYLDYFSHPDLHTRDLSSWKVAFAAAASGNPLLQETCRRLGLVLTNGYGVSECGGMSCQSLVTDSVQTGNETVGFPLPSTRLKLVDEEGKRVEPGTPGEAWLHDVYPGSCVGKGYYKMPERTAEVLSPQGWFRTGDLLAEDDDGYYRFMGRCKDMLKVGGFNVYPAEIEEALARHPGIAEAVVVGIPDVRMGEIPVAWVMPATDSKLESEEVMSYLRDHVSTYKLPRRIRFYEAGELPVTSNLKIQKAKLQEISIKEAGSSQH